MNDPELLDLRRRIRELQAIPERDRTDEQWDELNELEIRTAPGNRDSGRVRERQPEKRSSQTKRPRISKNGGTHVNNPRPDNARPDNVARPDNRVAPDGTEKVRKPPKRQHRRSRPVEVIGQS